MSEQTLALVNGANQGIGYEIAAGLRAFGWSVGVGDRDPATRAVADLDEAIDEKKAATALSTPRTRYGIT
jgi:NAD(P)-dependent dehydrogenase (short-subunit alcohol dehydrogenase family)